MKTTPVTRHRQHENQGRENTLCDCGRHRAHQCPVHWLSLLPSPTKCSQPNSPSPHIVTLPDTLGRQTREAEIWGDKAATRQNTHAPAVRKPTEDKRRRIQNSYTYTLETGNMDAGLGKKTRFHARLNLDQAKVTHPTQPAPFDSDL